MNIVLDVLKLRRVRLDYISPPICQVLFSGSGSSIMFEAVQVPPAPVNLNFEGQCARFLTWSSVAGTLCASLYKAHDINDPATPYTLIAECVPFGSVAVCSPGWWKYSTLTADGVESDLSNPIYSPGGTEVVFPINQVSGAVRFNLYKNPNPLTQSGTYQLVLSTVARSAIEVCEYSVCYKLQIITDDGPSELSLPICRTEPDNCCPSPGCPNTYDWDPVLCSCVPGITNVTNPITPTCFGAAYSTVLEVQGGSGPYTWSLAGGTIPPGLVFTPGTFDGNTITISGTPSTGGSFSFDLQVVDSIGGAFIKTFVIEVGGVEEGPVLPSAVTSSPYSEQLTGTGGTAPYTFVLGSGSLPTGLSLSVSGLISGTPTLPGSSSFSVLVTDALGKTCPADLSIDVIGCPAVITYPTISNTGQTSMFLGALDTTRRVLWIPHRAFSPSAPYRTIYLADLVTAAYLPNATDSNNLINTAAKGDTPGIGIIDTKYGQIVFSGSQGWFTWYDPDSKDCLAVTKPGGSGSGDMYNQNACYDSKRGYIYRGQHALGSVQTVVDIIDCAPGSRSTLSTFIQAGKFGGQLVYSPGADMVYIANESGPNLYHKWDPVTHAFTMNQGPAGTASDIRWIRVLDLLVIKDGAGTVYIIDPNNSDNVVTTFAYGGLNQLSQSIDYNDCTGEFYLGVAGTGTLIRRIDPSTGFSFVNMLGTGPYSNNFRFDPSGNLLWGINSTNGLIATF